MDGTIEVGPGSMKKAWAGRLISGLVVLVLLMDGVVKFVRPQPVVEAFNHLGLPIGLTLSLGILLLVCTALYAIPQTAIVGAVLLTGYLGGAVAIHMRVDDPLMSHVLFPIYLGMAAWLGLYLRDTKLRTIVNWYVAK